MLQGLCGFRRANFIKAVHSAVSCTKAQEDVGRSSRERRERLEYPPGPAGGVRSGCRGGQGGLFGPGARGRIVGWLAELCRRSVLGCIKGDVCNERIILQHFAIVPLQTSHHFAEVRHNFRILVECFEIS